jgi:hypothetical protein
MEPITLLILGGLAIAAFSAKKKKTTDNGVKPQVIDWVLEDLQGAEKTAVVKAGDRILIKLPGLVENYSLEITGPTRPLDDIMTIEQIGQQGIVIYDFGILDWAEPWKARINILGNKQPFVDFHIDYVV